MQTVHLGYTGWQKHACEIDVVPLCGVKCLLSLEWMSVCALAILLSNPLQSLHLNCGAHIADSTGPTTGNIPCFQAFAPASSGWIWLVNRDRGSAMPERRGEWGNKCLLRIAQEMQNGPCDVLSPERHMKTGTHICYPNVNSGHLVLSRLRGSGVAAGLRLSSGEAWVHSSEKWYSGGKKKNTSNLKG